MTRSQNSKKAKLDEISKEIDEWAKEFTKKSKRWY